MVAYEHSPQNPFQDPLRDLLPKPPKMASLTLPNLPDPQKVKISSPDPKNDLFSSF
jgi:hypothetical protein